MLTAGHNQNVSESISQRIVMKLLGSSVLFTHEWDALKDALKRDIDREKEMAQVDTDFSYWHQYNAHMVQRLLNVMRGEERESKAGDKPSRSHNAAPRNSTAPFGPVWAAVCLSADDAQDLQHTLIGAFMDHIQDK
jgi:hypothetical protein